jgi:hypothetical protein
MIPAENKKRKRIFFASLLVLYGIKNVMNKGVGGILHPWGITAKTPRRYC